MKPRHPARLAALAAFCLPLAAFAADIVISPPAAGGVAVTNAAGNATRLRVADDGTVSLPGLTALPVAGTGLCIDIATGRIGSCAAGGGSSGTVTSIAAGTGLTGGTITTSGTIGIANGGVGTGQLADGSVTLVKIAANGCASGQILKYNGAAWACSADAAGTVNGFAQGGNAFGFAAQIGTTDVQPVEIITNGTRAFRVEPDALTPNIVLGSSSNEVTAGAGGGTIGGGGGPSNTVPMEGLSYGCPQGCGNRVTDRGGTVGGGFGNRAGDFAGSPIDRLAPTVGGGLANTASGMFSAVLGGWANEASGDRGAVTGGSSNLASGAGSFVGGGIGNVASGDTGTVGGGSGNVASALFSTVPGGYLNEASGIFSFAAGNLAKANFRGSFVWSDDNGFAFPAASFNTFNVRATGGARFVTAIDVFGNPATTYAFGSGGVLGLPANVEVYRGSSRFIHARSTSNAFLGTSAGNAVSTGFENAALGHEALLANTIGAGNTAVGYRAMASMTESFNSTAVGAQALAGATGAGNIALGAFAGFAITTGADNIAIGNQGVAGDSGTMRLGGAQSRAFIAGVRGVTTASNNAIPVLIDGNGQLGTASSSRRFKDDIEDMGEASGGLMDLRPVTFHYKADGDPSGKRLQYGLIAEEVAAVYPGLVARSPDGQVETVMYQFLPPMLLNEVQKQQRTIETQAAEIAILKAQAGRLAAVEQELAAIRQALGIR